jgi:hypothetical protein
MNTFAYLIEEDAWDWYCNFKTKEIKSFSQLMKMFQKRQIYGYEEIEDAYVFLDVKKIM